MSSRANIPAEELRTALADGGWCVEAVHKGEEWWCREWWRLKSTWSPQDTDAFVAFLVDPLDETKTPKIWALRASPTPPAERRDRDGEWTFAFTGKWRQELPGLIRYLAALRHGVRSNSAFDSDTAASPLRARSGARQRGR